MAKMKKKKKRTFLKHPKGDAYDKSSQVYEFTPAESGEPKEDPMDPENKICEVVINSPASVDGKWVKSGYSLSNCYSSEIGDGDSMDEDYNTVDKKADQKNCNEGGKTTIYGYYAQNCKYV